MTAAGIAYLIRNTVNEKSYIGVTSQKASKRWAVHKRAAAGVGRGYLLHRAMSKYGIQNFVFEVIASAKTYSDLLATEILLIQQHNSCVSKQGGWGYNVTSGGEGVQGWVPSIECRQKHSVRLKGVPKTEEHKAALRGLKRSEEAREKMRNRRWSEEAKTHFRGRKWSDETRAKFEGKPRTEDVKAKLREAAKQGRLSAGAKARSRPVVTPNGRYPSLAAATRAEGVSLTGGWQWIKRKKNGWRYEDNAPPSCQSRAL